MYLDRDEFLLLSRRGSVPRAGPGRLRERPSAIYDRCVAAEAEGVPVRRRAALAAWRSVRSRLRWAGRPPSGAQRLRGYADRETYVELEFAVGFGVDEEPWL